ncbi:hypothetical protein NNC19_05025 [Clostridium sp. SHJSY1]|uniref:hypothetical protein n=1 Tax=Clostridium sp. SHJSY1 TaxID=2942483 RepID=UPI0028755C8B|nr:hypothetical protein [Clostridium sp. SHJSY1]MDS0525035.1 hypothetical protein [Clostridium sp. SHJSY1]
MSTIKVNPEKLLKFAKDMIDIKYELDLIMKDVETIEDTLDLVRDVDTRNQREQLSYVQDMGYYISRELNDFAEDLHYAGTQYKSVEENIKNSIGAMFQNYHMKGIADKVKQGKNIIFPLSVPNKYVDYEDYLISEEEANKYFTMGVFGASTVNGKKAKDMPSRIAYKKDGHLYIYVLCEVPEVEPILGGEIKVSYDGLNPQMVEQIKKYKYQQVYTSEPKIERLDGVIPFGVDGGRINQPATVGELIEFMNKREGVSARFASGDEEAYLKFVGAEASHMMMVDGTSDMIFRKDVSSRWTALHEWLHRHLQTKNGEITPGEDRIIESFLERHKGVLRIGNK